MIFYRNGVRKHDKGNPIMYDIADKIDFSVFPGHQGGPHNHTISALATGLKMAATPEFKTYQDQVMKNSQAFANRFKELGYSLVSGGTDNHLLLQEVSWKTTLLKLPTSRTELLRFLPTSRARADLSSRTSEPHSRKTTTQKSHS